MSDDLLKYTKALMESVNRQRPSGVTNSLFTARAEKEKQDRLASIERSLAEIAQKLPQTKNLIPDSLTPRQKEVAHCLAEGLNDDQIAGRLFMAKATSGKHRESIAEKWGITSHIELMQREARDRGYGQA